MASDRAATWTPDWVVTPGEILAEALDERGMTQAELARRMDRPLKTISEIVNGKAAITPDTAIQLERTLGISAALWNGLELEYRQHQARERAQEELAGYSEWAKGFPLADMRREGILPRGVSMVETASALLRFFGVANPAGWRHRWDTRLATFRSSTAHESTPHALSAWLRWGELIADQRSVEVFDRERLLGSVPEVRALTNLGLFQTAFARLSESLGHCGVVLIRLSPLTKAPLSGASYWLARDKAVIQLTLRYRANDQFWFTVLHEIGHLLEGGQTLRIDRPADLESTVEEVGEARVNAFARDALVPPAAYEAFVRRRDFSIVAIREFARSIGIHAGIVVGRLQHDDLLKSSERNGLKLFY